MGDKKLLFSLHKMKPVKLPDLPGLLPVSRNDIKRDIRDIEKTLINDTDSESSIYSEDILSSSYPVKPRKYLKVSIKPTERQAQIEEDEVDEKIEFDDLPVNIEEVLEFLKLVETARRDIYLTEKEREVLEMKYQALRDSFISVMKRFNNEKKPQENYIRVIQALFIRSLRVVSLNNRQNSMLYDALVALRRRRESILFIDGEINKLKMLNCQKPGLFQKKQTTTTVQNSTGALETNMLRVTMKPSNQVIVFYTTQWVLTPMGQAQIKQILPKSGKLVLQLSFGIMYSTFRHAARWGISDASSDSCLKQKWEKTDLSIRKSAENDRGIKELLGHVKFEEESCLTDIDDEDDDNDRTMSSDNDDEDEAGNEESAFDMTEPVENLKNMQNMSPNSSKITHSTVKGLNSASVPPVVINKMSVKILNHIQTRRGHNTLAAVDSSLLPKSDDCMPFLFTPPSAIPCLVDKLIGEPASLNNMSIRYCGEALTGGGQRGSTGAAAWQGNIKEMKRDLSVLRHEIKRIETSQLGYIRQIERSRTRASKLLQEATSIRLSNFTNRVCHRNAMSNIPMSQLNSPEGTKSNATKESSRTGITASSSLAMTASQHPNINSSSVVAAVQTSSPEGRIARSRLRTSLNIQSSSESIVDDEESGKVATTRARTSSRISANSAISVNTSDDSLKKRIRSNSITSSNDGPEPVATDTTKNSSNKKKDLSKRRVSNGRKNQNYDDDASGAEEDDSAVVDGEPNNISVENDEQVDSADADGTNDIPQKKKSRRAYRR